MQEKKKPNNANSSGSDRWLDDVGAGGGAPDRALTRGPYGLRALTAASHSNLCSPCDRRQAVAWHAGSFAHYHRRVEFLAGLQHAEAKHQELAHGSDHNLLSLEAPLSLEPIDQSNDRWVVTHRRQSRHVQGGAEHGIAHFGDPHGAVRDSRL